MRPQYIRQVSAFSGHFSSPLTFDILFGSVVRSPFIIDCDGHRWAHFLHASQNSVTPKSIGESATNGRSVITLLILTLGPNWGVINRPFLPS